jgi:hypothetical protein
MTGAAREGSAHRGRDARRRVSHAAPSPESKWGRVEKPEMGQGDERLTDAGERPAPRVLERALVPRGGAQSVRVGRNGASRRALVRNLCMAALSRRYLLRYV